MSTEVMNDTQVQTAPKSEKDPASDRFAVVKIPGTVFRTLEEAISAIEEHVGKVDVSQDVKDRLKHSLISAAMDSEYVSPHAISARIGWYPGGVETVLDAAGYSGLRTTGCVAYHATVTVTKSATKAILSARRKAVWAKKHVTFVAVGMDMKPDSQEIHTATTSKKNAASTAKAVVSDKSVRRQYVHPLHIFVDAERKMFRQMLENIGNAETIEHVRDAVNDALGVLETFQ